MQLVKYYENKFNIWLMWQEMNVHLFKIEIIFLQERFERDALLTPNTKPQVEKC